MLDVGDRSLKRNGAPIPLTPKTFDLLVTLVENSGRLVEKDSLLKTVWPDVAVEEGNLTKGVFSLRQVLEQEDGPRYIETVPKRGYRFVGAVTSSRDEPVTAVSSAPAVAAPSENSIAVMPLTDMSAARDHEFFCEGMSEEIINALGRVAGTLKLEYAEVLQVVEVAATPVKTFAEQKGLSANNAGVRVFRAREALKKRVMDSCGTCAEHGCVNCTCKQQG